MSEKQFTGEQIIAGYTKKGVSLTLVAYIAQDLTFALTLQVEGASQVALDFIQSQRDKIVKTFLERGDLEVQIDPLSIAKVLLEKGIYTVEAHSEEK